MMVQRMRSGMRDKWVIGYAIFELLTVVAVRFFIHRAIEIHREAKRSRIEPPATPPDFSTLDNGSQRWKNLEQIR